MASVVLLRAANVGGHQVLKPAEVAKALAHLDVVNIGAAGTFVVRAPASAAVIARELRRVLPFDPALAIRPGREVTALVRSAPFKGVPLSKDLRAWVGVMTDRPRQQPATPHTTPAGAGWHVRLDRITGRFALGLVRRRPRQIYPGKALEAALGVPITIRWWETLEKLAAILDA